MQLIDATDSLDYIWDYLVYAYVRLRHDPDTHDLAAEIMGHITKIESEVWKGQRGKWRAEIEAQAFVDAVNYRTDNRTKLFQPDLERANRTLPQALADQRLKRYFPIAPNKIIALSLSSQITYIEDYANSLPKESEEELKLYGQGFAADLKEGKEALTALASAASERRDHRVKDIGGLISNANKTLGTIAGELQKRAAQKHKPSDWADSFFRKQQRNTPEERKLQKKREAILATCEAYDVVLDTENRKKIRQEQDPVLLRTWLKNAASAATVDEVFAAVPA
jgi:hypothetical protein